MSEFSGIEGLTAWRTKLKELLAAADAAARQDELEPRLQIVERLTQFIENSWPDDESVRALDSIATKTIDALLDQSILERLKNIAQRNAELAVLSKKFTTAAAQAEQAAANIRLQRLQDALDAANGGIVAFKRLRETLKSDGDAALQQSVTDAMDAAKRLKDLINAPG